MVNAKDKAKVMAEAKAGVQDKVEVKPKAKDAA